MMRRSSAHRHFCRDHDDDGKPPTCPRCRNAFLVADGELAHVSSSLIKEIAGEADAAMLASFLPPVAVEAVMRRWGRNENQVRSFIALEISSRVRSKISRYLDRHVTDLRRLG